MPRPQGRAKGQTRRGGQEPSPWSRVFDVITHRAFVAAAFVAAAAVCVLAVEPANLIAAEQWMRAHSDPEMARGLAVALVMAVAGLAGLGWRRWRMKGAPDRVVGQEPTGRRTVWMGRLGALLFAAGALLVVGDWLASHRTVPAAELVLPLQDTQEAVEVVQGDRTVDAMLPLRTTLTGVGFGDEPRAEIRFAQPNQSGVTPREFVPGQSLDIDGMRFVFSGFTRDETRLRAVFSSPDDQTIGAAGVTGDRIQLSIDGPMYNVVDVTDDYLDVYAPAPGMDRETTQMMLLARGYPLGVMGPAAQLEDERGRTFWVFQRAAEREPMPQIPEGMRLDAVHEVPSAVMTVSSARPFWPFALGMLLFVIGWALLFAFPERIVRRRKDGAFAVWSLNEIEAFKDGDRPGRRSTSVLRKSGPLLAAILVLGLAFVWGTTAGAVVAFGGLAALVALPTWIDNPAARRAALVALAVPVGVVASATAVWGLPAAMEAQLEPVLWVIQIGSWLAMAVALVAAGVLAEESLDVPATGGTVTAGLAVWASMGAVVAMALERGGAVGASMALPLVSDSGEAVWSIPDIAAVAELQIPVTADATQVAVLALVTAALAAVGIGGAVLRIARLSHFGWIGTSVTSVVGLLQIAGVGGAAVEQPDAAAYEQWATRWLDRQELPGWIAEYGDFQIQGDLQLDTAALFPEIVAFSVALALSLAMIASLVLRRVQKTLSPGGPAAALAGRDVFVRAIMFGAMGWVVGLQLSWERVGAAGILGPMEWLGLSVILGATGILTLGWHRGPSVPAKFARAFGPALVLCFLVAVATAAAIGGIAPGGSVPLW